MHWISCPKKAENAGFAVQSASHLGFFVYPAFRFVKLRNRQKTKQTELETQNSVKNLIQLGGPVMNEALYFLMRLELNLGRMIRYPRGIRCLITLKKKT